MIYCYQCPYFGEWTGTNIGYCSKLETTVHGESVIVEQLCQDNEI